MGKHMDLLCFSGLIDGFKMAADDDTVARRVIKQRIKPEIYTTIDGKTIVEDELLSFLAVKLKTVPQDDIILMAVNHFRSGAVLCSSEKTTERCQQW